MKTMKCKIQLYRKQTRSYITIYDDLPPCLFDDREWPSQIIEIHQDMFPGWKVSVIEIPERCVRVIVPVK